ncbi:riboflavin-specific deaminase-like protein [Paenibacillus anaericanus]|uniref:dihydrofolate reductase family protein n=1 Tax=Paenibacillus anaericanus TaxID=170367 RepID=UPI00278559C7|nr:dihydrofolate reductase family protein [Paenibacillus anaericanus]MDQ0087109.1 riboflavin-specific deaminase-like protein [Paenibacillus anaericanus]
MKTSIFSQISIDGKLTLGAGQSSKPLFSLFNNQDIEYIHKFRGKVDGIMVGKNTISTDDPYLTNRFEENKNPIRIIPTRSMDIPMDSHVLNDEGRTIIVTTENGQDENKINMLRERNVECLICGKDEVDFSLLNYRLETEFGITSLMVEGGGFLNWHVFKQDLVDEIILMQLPIIIGGASNITLVDGAGYNELEFAKRFKVAEVLPQDNYTLLRYLKAI